MVEFKFKLFKTNNSPLISWFHSNGIQKLLFLRATLCFSTPGFIDYSSAQKYHSLSLLSHPMRFWIVAETMILRGEIECVARIVQISLLLCERVFLRVGIGRGGAIGKSEKTTAHILEQDWLLSHLAIHVSILFIFCWLSLNSCK